MKRIGVVLIVIMSLSGCDFRMNQGEKAAVVQGTGAAGQVIGIPLPVGEAVGAAVVAILTYLGGKKHGQICERKKTKAKETTNG